MEDRIQYRVGTMVKHPRLMTSQERAEWRQQRMEKTKEYLFSINQPLVYVREDGHTVAEYKNGTVLIVR